MNIFKSRISEDIQHEFNQLSRTFTYSTAVIVCVAALIFWSLGLEVKGNTATAIGGMFIVLAAITLKVPYIAYRYLLYKYKNDDEKLTELGSSWRDFKDRTTRR